MADVSSGAKTSKRGRNCRISAISASSACSDGLKSTLKNADRKSVWRRPGSAGVSSNIHVGLSVGVLTQPLQDTDVIGHRGPAHVEDAAESGVFHLHIAGGAGKLH